MALAMRDFLREAVFLWITPFLVALSKVDMAFFIASAASVFLPAEIRLLTSFTADLNLSLVVMLRSRLRMDWRMALAADLVFGIVV